LFSGVAKTQVKADPVRFDPVGFCQRLRQSAWSAQFGLLYRVAFDKGAGWMRCVECGSSAVSERPEHTAQGYRRFRCRSCRKQFNERMKGLRSPWQFIQSAAASVRYLATPRMRAASASRPRAKAYLL
jgi:hypothetical protein